MKLKNKGKVFPSPSSSSAATTGGSSDFLSVLTLLPAAILALASVLSLPDREVLAYMLTMSLKSTPPSSNKKSSKKPSSSHGGIGIGSGSSSSTSSSSPHKAPVFGCDCFDCYTSYWFRWDSSPNRELIHQVIEAFEEHLLTAEQPNSKKNKRHRDNKNSTRRIAAAPPSPASDSKLNQLIPPPPPPDESAASIIIPPAVIELEIPEAREEVREEERAVVLRLPPAAEGSGGHKGIGRKVLPDVFGLLNSRLWSLWGPNI